MISNLGLLNAFERATAMAALPESKAPKVHGGQRARRRRALAAAAAKQDMEVETVPSAAAVDVEVMPGKVETVPSAAAADVEVAPGEVEIHMASQTDGVDKQSAELALLIENVFGIVLVKTKVRYPINMSWSAIKDDIEKNYGKMTCIDFYEGDLLRQVSGDCPLPAVVDGRIFGGKMPKMLPPYMTSIYAKIQTGGMANTTVSELCEFTIAEFEDTLLKLKENQRSTFSGICRVGGTRAAVRYNVSEASFEMKASEFFKAQTEKSGFKNIPDWIPIVSREAVKYFELCRPDVRNFHVSTGPSIPFSGQVRRHHFVKVPTAVGQPCRG